MNMAHEYDNAFRTMEMDCPKLLIPVVNEIFHTKYSLDEKVVILPNEQMITTPEDEQTIRITDSNFMIIGREKAKFHIECESNPKTGELTIRFFQYDTQIALDNRHWENGVLHVPLPKSAVLYLRQRKNTPESLKMVIEDGNQKIYRNIPVVKVQTYSVDEIFEKKLWFFLPFHIFVHEKRLSMYNKDESKRKILLKEYEDISRRLDDLCVTGEISELEKHCIITSMREVLSLIAKNQKKVLKEADEVMGGKVLEYEAKTIYRDGMKEGIVAGKLEGEKEGIQKGIKEGIKEGIEQVATRLLQRGESVEQVMDDTGLPSDAIENLLKSITVK